MNEPDFLKIIAENTRDVISIFDPDFNRLYVSKSVYDVFGYTSTEILSMDVNQPIPDEDAKRAGPIVQQHLAERKTCTIEHRVIHKNGTMMWVEAVVRPIIGADGNVSFILTSARDISDRKAKEQELQAERQLTEQLYNISSISHEIRTPLTALLSGVQLLRREKDPNGHEQVLRTLESAGEMLLGLVNNVLDYTKIRHGKTIIHETDVNFHDLCVNTISLYRSVAEDKNLRLYLQVEEGVPRFIFSDPYKLNQILANLVANAIKFTRAGRIDVRVSAFAKENMIELSVSDTGVGIPGKMLDRIFDPFVKEESSATSMVNNGAGLGLAIVKTLVGLLHGTISVRSEINQGTTFTVRLPLVRGLARQKEIETTIAAMQILLVEDSLSTQVLYKRLFESAGAHCETASDVSQALKLLERAETFDVVLLDINLAGENSLTLVPQIMKARKDVPIIAFTADASAEILASVRRAGIDHILIKPASVPLLFETIGKFNKHARKEIDLTLYRRLHAESPREYENALTLLVRDLDRFCIDLAASIQSRNSAMLRFTLHRIRPIGAQLKIASLNKLSDAEQLAAAGKWDELQHTTTEVLVRLQALKREILVESSNLS